MAYSDVVLADNPHFYWRLDEEGGTTAFNSGSGGPILNGTTANLTVDAGTEIDQSPLLPGDPNGRSVKFPDGASGQLRGDVGETRYAANAATPKSFSVEAWFKYEGNFPQSEQIVNVNDPYLNGQGIWTVYEGGKTYIAGEVARNSTGGAFPCVTDVEVTAGTLYHVVMTTRIQVNSSSGLNEAVINVYVNGELRGTQTQSQSQYPTISISHRNVLIPGSVASPRSGSSLFVDEVAIYISELSAERITAHYVSGMDVPVVVYEAESSEPGWHIYLHDWDGARIGELTDAKNVQISTGLNKNSSMTFETTLLSPLGKQIADRDYSLVSAWRQNPYNGNNKLIFSGMVFTTEEQGEDQTPTIAVSAVGPYWRLSKRVANDSTNAGRQQQGLAPAPSNLTLLVVDRGNHRIQRFDAQSGAHIGSFGSYGTGNGQFSNPQSVAVGLDNSIYVVDRSNHRIQKFSSTGGFIKKWGSYGTGDNQLNYPWGIAVDPSGNVWVSDNLNNRVVKYDANGNFLLKANISTANASLQHVSVDENGTVIVADNRSSGTKGWYYISSSGKVTPANNSTRHEKVMKDNAGNWYFVQTAADVYRNTPSRKIKSKIFDVSGEAPTSIAVGDDRSMYISINSTSSSISKINRYDAAGNLTRVIGSYGSAATQLNNPTDVALLRPSTRDAIEIASEVITNANNLEGNTWVRPAPAQGTSNQLYINPGTWGGYKRISEVIEDLSGNFEWKIVPQMTADSRGLILGHWYADAVIGEDRSNLVTFEYGAGRNNVDSYSIKRSLEGLITKASYPAADNVPYSITATASNLGQIGVFEDVVTGTLIDQNLRRSLLNYALSFRKEPRMLIEVSPTRSDQTGPDNLRVPIPLVDYDLGDIIGLEIVEDGEERIATAEARVYDIIIDIDENGKETATIKLYLD